ncbi:hypothetical protein JNO63_02635 [Anaerococcus sp. mt242]|uniref:hypothetical protein n=1 Tax=Anaerococcus sp. mt242 TaxID=2661917 RepID=UPI0019341FD7|nr:hypothetical protein [uncultured Anaerococcus sp.]MBM0045980.1 hypothetical protein [Anaerococcus sp. mt242]
MCEKTSRNLFALGAIIFVISYFIPLDLFNTFTNLKPTGLTSMFVCPIIGLVGSIFGIKESNKLFIVLNVLLILLLPIAMFAGHIIAT